MSIIRVKVKPNARQSRLVEQPDGSFLAEVKSPPVDGKANEELIRLVAEHFGCSRRSVSVKSGGHSRMKLLTVSTDG